jgi:hypothetical protein
LRETASCWKSPQCLRVPGSSVGSFGRVGRGPGEFENLHNIAIHSKGNIYAAEVWGQRVQRFLYKGDLPTVGQLNAPCRIKQKATVWPAPVAHRLRQLLSKFTA